MDLSPDRIRSALSWRLDMARGKLRSLYRPLDVWIENRMLPARVRAGRSNFDRDRLTRSYRAAWEILLQREPVHGLGDFLEFGVYYGTSLSCMHEALHQLKLDHVRIFGFDSFEGMPAASAREDSAIWHPGQFAASLELTREYLDRHNAPPDRVILTKGWFSETLTPALAERHGLKRASVLMVDCDLYSSAADALAFVAPLIDTQAVVFFDDWNAAHLADQNMGERRAFEEFLAAHPQMQAEELDGLNYSDLPHVKVFLVTVPPGSQLPQHAPRAPEHP